MENRGWEHRKIGEFAQEIYVGAMPKLSERKAGNFPTIQLKDIITLKSPFLHECKTLLDISNIKNKRTATYGDILIVYSSGKKVVGRVFVYLGKEECMIGEGICVIKHLQNPKYLLHVLNSPSIQRQIQWATQKQTAIGGLRSCSVSDLKNISIPLPSLTEQEQIANYLDNLLLSEVQLSDSLEKMLEIRKKQYEYYKEQILTSEIDKWDR